MTQADVQAIRDALAAQVAEDKQMDFAGPIVEERARSLTIFDALLDCMTRLAALENTQK